MEQLVQQFYEWEIRGRGWLLWNEPVLLEPPFRPFLGHYLASAPVHDDGRKPTILTKMTEKLSAWLAPGSSSIETTCESEHEEPSPGIADEDVTWTTLQILMSGETATHREQLEQFLLTLGYCEHPLCLEIIASSESIKLQLAIAVADLVLVEPQLAVNFPEIVFSQTKDTIQSMPLCPTDLAVDFGLSREFMLPLGNSSRAGVMTAILGALSFLHAGEAALVQVIFQPVKYPWSESILRAVTMDDGGHFFANAPEFTPETRRKLSRPLYSVGLRIICHSADGQPWELARSLASSLSILANPTGNEFIPLANDGYDFLEHARDMLCRRVRRSGMILNSDELISLIQFPPAADRIAKLERSTRKTKKAPEIATGQGILLGINIHQAERREIRLGSKERLRHTHIIGASGTGKSTLLLHLIQQDIENGNGIAVLDPHGDLIDEITARIPEHRLNDVILLDPSDEAYPIGFNILSAHSDLEKNLLSSDLVAVFRRLSTSWGDQMTSVLGNAILAFLESSQGGTLADLRRFLVEPDYRARFLATVADPEVVYYWQKEFTLLTGKPQAPLLTRLDAFLRPRTIRYMVAQKGNRLDFSDIMNGKKILLAKLSQGAIGEENSYLLGSLIVAKLHQMVMGRQELKESQRPPFFLYVDEFHHFVTPSMANILTGARKYGLGLILAHQELRQLENRDTDVASAVISNPYTRICFRLGDHDARKMADGFSFFEAKDLQNLGTGEAICRVERSDFDFNLSVPPLATISEMEASARRSHVVSISRNRYATPREQIEAMLAVDRASAVSKDIPEPANQSAIPSAIPHERRQRQVVPLESRPTPAKSVTTSPAEPKTLGRGSPKHKYLQHLIKQWAEGMGYRATIEQLTLDGQGSVDVALEKSNRRIACEIAVGSSLEQEVKNLRKCLADRFDYIVVVPAEEGRVEKLRKTFLDEVSESDAARTQVLIPEELFAFVQGLEAADAGKQDTVKGYKVKLGYRAIAPKDVEARKRLISQVVVDGLKRIKSK